VRINAQLIDATNEAHIWGDRFDGVLDDVFELQDRVASGVAGVIEPRLQLAEIDRADRKPPQNLGAYDLYLRARGEFHKHSDQGSRRAIELAKRALAIDPDYAPAAALFGECWLTRGAQGWDPATAADREEIIRLAKHAIRSGRTDPDALWMAAVSLSAFSDEHTLADSAMERALTLNPNSAQAWNACGYIRFKQNDIGAAIEAQKRAIRLSPLDPLKGYFSTVLAQSYLSAERYEEALAAAEDCLCEMPTSISAMRTKTIACVRLGRIEHARAALAQWLQLRPQATIASCKATVLKHLPPEILAAQVDSLRRAGLPDA
jgi:tetratricopeptide (TPR) repeat protein